MFWYVWGAMATLLALFAGLTFKEMPVLAVIAYFVASGMIGWMSGTLDGTERAIKERHDHFDRTGPRDDGRSDGSDQ